MSANHKRQTMAKQTRERIVKERLDRKRDQKQDKRRAASQLGEHAKSQAAPAAARYMLVTLHEDEEDHHLLNSDHLRPGDEFQTTHRGTTSTVRVEAVEPSAIEGIDARVSARVVES